jgi:sterol 24-C-methyltransferase
MAFYEHRLAHLMHLRPGMKVLDVGCGVGGPAREIAKFIGCQVVGITINQRQLNAAIELTAQAGLGELCTFVRGDFLKLEEIFGEGKFDAAYAIEATVHAPSLKEVYAGIARVLKPGAVFGVSEWVLTPKFDERNIKHVGIRNRIERGNGVSNLHTSAQCREAMVQAGFKLFHDEDYAKHWDYLGREGQSVAPPFSAVTVPMKGGEEVLATPPSCQIQAQAAPLRPWYWPLAGQYKLATTWEDWWIAFRLSRHPRLVAYWTIWMLEKLRLYPKGVIEAMTTIAYCVDSVVEGGREDCFTPCWWFIGRKEGEDRRDCERDGNLEEGKGGKGGRFS